MPATTPARSISAGLSFAVVAALLLAVSACDDGRKAAGRGSDTMMRPAQPRMQPDVPPEWTTDEPAAAEGSVPMDFGEDWEEVARKLRGDGYDPAVSPSGVSGDALDADTWGIVLETFVGEESRSSAEQVVRDLPRFHPQLATAWVHTTKKGSMVVYGRYSSPQDPAAKQDLEWIKSLKYGERTVFGRVMMGNVTDHSRRRWRPVDLMSARQRYPDVNPLYTLQVAVWGSFEGAFPWEEAKRRAEGYAAQLRTQGHPAFVHHDAAKELAMVTVGLFDRGAIDPQSGLFRADVETVLGSFPEHLINGEPLEIANDGRDPSRGTKKQKPVLVLVPELN